MRTPIASSLRHLYCSNRPMSSSYENWSREDLIARLKELEGSHVNAHPALNDTHIAPEGPTAIPASPKTNKFHFASYPRRKIALKFCYSGWEYNGLAYQLNPTPLPTVEGVIFDVLSRTKLIDPDAGYVGCGWEKCGRTDRGVSAGGQVISLWVRSALEERLFAQSPRATPSESVVKGEREAEETSMVDDGFGSLSLNDGEEEPVLPPTQTSRPELDYIAVLNRLLPPTIRMLAWSPVSDTFSARFACKYRHYKYFFSSERLDISKMRDAASRLLGQHDFRNLCKLDPAKQITNFERRILRADIDPLVEPSTASSIYVLNLIGTAFLYHQVRHIMSVLLMVGRGLEHPSIVTSLLNIREGIERSREEETIEVVGCKPEYQMADALPLMLWDCAYSEEDVKWRTDGHEPGSDSPPEDGRGLYHLLHSIRSRSEIFLALNQHFLEAASMFFPEPWAITKQGTVGVKFSGKIMVEVPLGGGASKKLQQYVPLLQRKRLDPVEVANERWRNGKGLRKDESKIAADQESVEGDLNSSCKLRFGELAIYSSMLPQYPNLSYHTRIIKHFSAVYSIPIETAREYFLSDK